MSGTWWEESNGSNGAGRVPPKRQSSQESGFNGGHRELKSNSRRPSDAYVGIQSDSEGTKQRRASVKAHNRSASRKRSRNTLKEKRSEAPVDDDAWIHRDKLAQIEIQEMEEAGIHVRSSRRSLSAGPGASARSSRSQSRSRRPMSKEQPEHYVPEDGYGWDENGRKRVSTIPAADEEEHEFDPTIDTEFRTPEEVAAERRSPQQVIRPSTSRIPLAKSPSVPVPQDVVDRDSPLPRSRHGSGAYSGNWDDMQYARRARSNSIGSQVLLDDGMRTPSRPGSSHLRNSNENSPPKSRVPNKTPTSGGRKTSGINGSSGRPPSSSAKTGTATRTTSGAQRPVSRGGHKSRPSTSHAPEGEAPWIAGMYKPDPRLPPEQQMLPTHAKRLQQEQWEREGKGSTAFDRDFRPLNDDPFPSKPTSPIKQLPSPAGSGFTSGPTSPNANLNAWPLTPQSETVRSEGGVSANGDKTSPSRPGTSGGYKITPTITTPPPYQKSPPPPASPMIQGHNATPRVPEISEKDDAGSKKGACACCIIM